MPTSTGSSSFTTSALSINKKSGFTLVELLVVISIISILAIVGMVSYVGTQKGARDAKRRIDVDAIANVLEAHYADTASPCNATAPTPYCVSAAITGGTFFATNAYPTNPTPGGADYSLTISGQTAYTICALLENGNGNSSSAGDGSNFATPPPATYYCRKNQQ